MSIATYARKKKAPIPSTISFLSSAPFLTKAKDANNKENIDATITSKKPTRARNTALQPKKAAVKKPVSPDEKPKKKREDPGLNKFLEEKSKAFAQVDEFQFVVSEAEPTETKKKQLEPEDLSIFKALRSVSESMRSNATVDSNMLDLDIEPMPAQFVPESPLPGAVEDELPGLEQFFKSAPLASSQDEILPPTSTPGRMQVTHPAPAKKNTTAKAPTQAKATKASRPKKAAPSKKQPAKKAGDADLADFLFNEFVQPQDSHDVAEEVDVFATPIKPFGARHNDVVQDTPSTIQLKESCKDEYKVILDDYLAYRQVIKQSGLPPMSLEEFSTIQMLM